MSEQSGITIAEALSTADRLLLARYTSLQRHFLLRLLYMDAVRHSAEAEGELDDERRRLLDRAIYGAWRDCADEGVGNEAKLVLKTGSD